MLGDFLLALSCGDICSKEPLQSPFGVASKTVTFPTLQANDGSKGEEGIVKTDKDGFF